MAQRPPPTPMLQAFVSAAQTGSFARAAFELNLTASAISHQIAGLEEWWGVQLFERHSRGVKLTTAGQALLPVTDGFSKNWIRCCIRSTRVDPSHFTFHAPPLFVQPG